MASEMVKRVAQTLAKLEGLYIDDFEDRSALPTLSRARAAIAAMREPTHDQLSRATLSFPPWGGHGEGPAPSQSDMWRAMIDAALEETPRGSEPNAA